MFSPTNASPCSKISGQGRQSLESESDDDDEEVGTPANKRPKTVPKTNDSVKVVSESHTRGSCPSSSTLREESGK